MTRKRTPLEGDAFCVDFALYLLRQALEELKRAGRLRTAARVRLAISSAKGALRHARNSRQRETQDVSPT